MVRVPRVQLGLEAVLRVILRRRLTARPFMSAVSRPEVETEELMPLLSRSVHLIATQGWLGNSSI